MNKQKAKVIKKQFKNLIFPAAIGIGLGVALNSFAVGVTIGTVFSIVFTNAINRKHRLAFDKNKS